MNTILKQVRDRIRILIYNLNTNKHIENMEVTTVGELEVLLATIKDKSLSIRLINEAVEDEENIWVHSIELSDTGASGYELEGEVRLIGGE